MDFLESQSLELKREFTPDLKKEVIAFANSNNGTIYIGVDDDRTVVGVDNIDEVSLKISNMIIGSIKPDVTMVIKHKIYDVENKKVLGIEIERGTNRPYYIGEKGLKPSGVYVRQGSSSVPSSDNAFLISLPNFNYNFIGDDNNNYSRKILRYLNQNESISRKEVEALLHVKQTMAGRLLKTMINDNLIRSNGHGSKIRYLKK